MTLERARTTTRGADCLPWVLYVLEVVPRLAHCRYYVGVTNNLGRRLEQHRRGQGARCLQVACERGSELRVVAEFRAGYSYAEARKLERKVKGWKNNARTLRGTL